MPAARPLTALLADLDAALTPEDRTVRDAGLERARELVQRLPLLHRTSKPRPNVPDTDPPENVLQRILGAGRLGARHEANAFERTVGWERVAYASLGATSYDTHGHTAFVLSKALLAPGDTFTPFDSGALTCSDGLRADDPAAALARALGQATEAVDFTAHFAASHCADPADYARTDVSLPLRRALTHGIASTQDDRRAWTVEVQFHRDVPLPADDRFTLLVRDADRDALLDVPDAYLRCVVVTPAPLGEVANGLVDG